MTGLPRCAKGQYKVLRIMSPLELKKLKKDYLNLVKLHPPKGKSIDHLGEPFLDFLCARVAESLE